jgi:hypothetical protein
MGSITKIYSSIQAEYKNTNKALFVWPAAFEKQL